MDEGSSEDKEVKEKKIHSIENIKTSPSDFMDKRIRLRGEFYYIGEREVRRIRSINLPESETVKMGVLVEGDNEIQCFLPADIKPEEFSKKRVEVEGELIYSGGEYIMKVSSIKIIE